MLANTTADKRKEGSPQVCLMMNILKKKSKLFQEEEWGSCRCHWLNFDLRTPLCPSGTCLLALLALMWSFNRTGLDGLPDQARPADRIKDKTEENDQISTYNRLMEPITGFLKFCFFMVCPLLVKPTSAQ